MIDDILYCIGDNMSRRKVYKHLEKCDFDIDATIDRILWIREKEAERKQKKAEKRKEEGMVKDAQKIGGLQQT